MTSAQPNIVLVSIDSLRADHCGYLGDERGLTPTLDVLADGGIAFENAVAPGPQTFSSVPASFTGAYRPAGGVEQYPGATHWERRLAAIESHLDWYAPLQERLQDEGYTTAGFSPNPWTSSASGFDRGFDHFADISGRDRDGRIAALADRLPGVDPESKPVQLTLDLLTGSSFFAGWRGFYDELDRIRAGLEEPYFLWVFLMDTHFPFITARRDREEQSLLGMYYNTYRTEGAMRGTAADLSGDGVGALKRSYRDAVRASDAFLSRLHTETRADDPVLLVHSDHGESLGEHGNFGHHHRRPFEENVHVPFVVHNAGVTETVEEPLSLASLHDVTLSVARDGTVDPSRFTDADAISASECGRYRAVRGERYKLLDLDGEERLYDLARDPNERDDIAADRPERVGRMRDRLEAFERHRNETGRLRQVVHEQAGRGVL